MKIVNILKLTSILACAFSSFAYGQVIYQNEFDNLDGFTLNPSTAQADRGVQLTSFGSGNGMQVYQDEGASQATSTGVISDTGVTDPLRLDMDFVNNSDHSAGFAIIQFALGNPDGTPTFSSAVPFYLQFRSDSRVRVYYNGGNSLGSTLTSGTHTLSLIINPSTTESYTYEALNGSGERTILPSTLDAYVDDVIMGADLDGFDFFSNSYVPANGIGSIGWATGVTAGSIDVDYTYGNVLVTSLIPEASSSSMVLALGAMAGCLVFLRRKRK